jgi:hypothetical protein
LVICAGAFLASSLFLPHLESHLAITMMGRAKNKKVDLMVFAKTTRHELAWPRFGGQALGDFVS